MTVSWSTFVDTKNRADVLRFLNLAGYEVATRTFYRHCDRGLLSKNDKGLYTQRLVKAYALNNLAPVEGQEGNEGALAVQKLESEIARIETITRRERFRLELEQGKYIKKMDMYLHLAARAAVLDNGFKQMMQSRAMELIVLVGGKTDRLPDFTEELLAHWSEMLGRYAGSEEMEVLFEVDP